MSMNAAIPLTPEQWMRGVLGTQAARDGRVLRRKLDHFNRYVGRARFVAEWQRCGYHAVENGGQMIIFCNNEPVRIVP
ncbi:N-(5'-phosphoribosyl)anthranilate isomerase [Roseovarius sp. S1116L3]|uniref:N-(5'-phosphoribosyl)anthranilate isomerase n=1 Tax=Roseovarius roseus TaxID=3342636 RepID=UPI0037270CA4